MTHRCHNANLRFKHVTSEEVLERLTRYEDVGLYPEEVEQLQKENAELKARLEKSVELPCKVGDTVYNIYDAEVEYGGKAIIEHCIVSEVSTRRMWIENNSKKFKLSDIGEIIFLTREAAKQALKERCYVHV